MSGVPLNCPICRKGVGRLLVDAVLGAEPSTLTHVCDRCGHEWKAHDSEDDSADDAEPTPAQIRFDVLHASTSLPNVEPEIHKPLCDAIEEKNITEIEFHNGKTKLGEPHVYGVMDGVPRLLFFDEYGDKPSWRLIDVRNIAQVKRWLNQHFTARPLPPKFDPTE